MKELNATVFPSNEKTISVREDSDYGGAHEYEMQECKGYDPYTKETGYCITTQRIRFIQKKTDGTVIPGLQSEQLVLMLLDRHAKLNAKFPSPQNEKMIQGLQMFLDACKERIEDRINREVMGELKA